MPRPRKPIEQRIAEGTMRTKHRKIAEEMPKALVITIQECPDLSPEAKKYWPRFREMFGALHVVTESDLLAVQRLVETYAELRGYQKVLKEEGIFYTSDTRGGIIKRAHPALAALSDADKRFRAYLSDFGLTPAARSKVKGTENGNTQDPLEEFGV